MTSTFRDLLLIGAILMPIVGALISVIAIGKAENRFRAVASMAWAGFGLALAATISVALGGSFTVSLIGGSSQPSVGLLANQFTVVLLVLVCGVGALVQSFSIRYLQADRAAHRFFGATNLVVAATAIVCTSSTTSLLVAAWVAAGLAFVVVVGYRPDLPGVRHAALRTLKMFSIGDLAVLVAFITLSIRVGNINLASVDALRIASERLGNLSTIVALLLVLGALTRSAQGTLGRWLPSTVSAPTPVSALLHAGVVNGGGILLIRLGPLTGNSVLAMVVAFVIAGSTSIVATAIMTTKADVKGTLAFSTISQMGFMIAECTIGAYLAATIHLIGHAMYKAALFFGSGSQIKRVGQAPIASTTATSTLKRLVATAAIVTATVGVMLTIPDVLAHHGGRSLLVFTAITTSIAAWSWWGRRPDSGILSAVWLALIICAGALYGLVLAVLGRWISPALPSVGTGTLSPWWLVGSAIAGFLVIFALTRSPNQKRRLVAILLELGAANTESTRDANRRTRSIDSVGGFARSPRKTPSITENLA